MLTAISPVDGRYASKCVALKNIFSEFALIKRRVHVEVEWLICLLNTFPDLPQLADEEVMYLRAMSDEFSEQDALEIKKLEMMTNHDVKAVEYFIKQKAPKAVVELVHFCCTSEDISNLAYGSMFKDYLVQVLLPKLDKIVSLLIELVHHASTIPLLAVTHGQPATPSTFGKEMSIFVHRLQRQIGIVRSQENFGKFSGASGNFNAHHVAYPGADWPLIAERFVTGLGLSYQPLSTQIECHDYISELCDVITRTNTILTDLTRDVWLYVSRGILKLKVVSSEIGSSTMPHKVNPIDFENCEGNLGVASALLTHFSQKLPMSRLQRDLTDSTVLRSFGVAAGHVLIAHESLIRGLSKISVNEDACDLELESNWSVLTEAVQTVMRKRGIPNAYERIKAASRGQAFDKDAYMHWVDSIKPEISAEDYAQLLELTPRSYTGLAATLCSLVCISQPSLSTSPSSL